MQISGANSTNAASRGAASSNIAKLQKQLRELTDELRGVAGQDIDAKAKQEKIKLLQAQIQMVQQQIAAIARQSQQEQAARQQQAQATRDPSTKAAPAPTGRRTPGLGDTVDTFA
ncbi:FlxA-like family protein [Acidovorax sp. ACV01]|uniref:FlxA-like family protein n=1 Tax=Acidovorax sp. ACV01 TaxID=2769311 RepID=UPI0017810942|nr:FlxA-like family protein [Acidovorax sp. ACV01]MBD9390799.1 FlxA-like family protein [Acidovorax sp. ACV01]